jgi:outer membrane protein OmpA-like peptidoglycan-associated protein
MESIFGADFSGVRIHTGLAASRSASLLRASAYTVGPHIIVRESSFTPGSDHDRPTLAHELTHVIQQAQGPVAGSPAPDGAVSVSDPRDPFEQQAEQIAQRVAAKQTTGPSGASSDVYRGPSALLGASAPTVAAGGQMSASSPAASNEVQRIGDPTKVPPDLDCEVGRDSPADTVDAVLFPNGIASLTVSDRAQIDNFVINWRAAGGTAAVRIDGYASTPGSDELNWRLSCARAKDVTDELTNPTSGIPGIPAGLIRIVAQGETNEFGAVDKNRRATISSPLGPVPATCAKGLPVSPVNACIQPIVVAETDGSAPTAEPSMDTVRSIWAKCCITMTINSTMTVANSALKEIDDAGSGAPLTAEEQLLFAPAAGNGCVPVAIVDTIRRGANAGKDVAGGGTTKDMGTDQPKVVCVAGVDPTVVAHEVGHALTLLHTDDVGGTTVMHPSGAYNVAVPENVVTAECDKARLAAAVRSTSAGSCCEEVL